jgi:hypothetical protein
MMRSVFVLALVALASTGCWGEVNPIFPDGGGTDDTDTTPQPELYPGGGVGGGPLDGVLNLYFIDEATGAGIAGVKVMVGDDPATVLVGSTSADGLVVFDDPALVGAVDVHALADGHVFESIVALAWANATLPLRPDGAMEDEGATATVAGEIAGWEALPDPGATEYRIARVYYGETRASLLTVRGRYFMPRGVDAVELRPDLEGGAFSLEVRARPGALYAVAGVVETFGTTDVADDVTDWSTLGVVGGLAPLSGDTVSGIEVPLDTPLSVEVNVVLQAVPSSFERKDVFLGFDLGAEGTAWLEAVRTADTFKFAAPLPAGDYADAGPMLVGAAEQLGGEEPDAGPFADLPRSYAFDRGFDTWLGYEAVPWALDEPLPAPASLAWDGAAFTCLPTTGRSLSQLVVSDAATGGELWRVTAWGDLPGTLPYPSLPPGWDAPTVPASGVSIEVFVDTLAGGTSEMLFDEFSSVATSRVLHGAIVE